MSLSERCRFLMERKRTTWILLLMSLSPKLCQSRYLFHSQRSNLLRRALASTRVPPTLTWFSHAINCYATNVRDYPTLSKREPCDGSEALKDPVEDPRFFRAHRSRTFLTPLKPRELQFTVTVAAAVPRLKRATV